MAANPTPIVEPFFVLRAPSLPFSFLEAWSRATTVLGADDPAVALEADREALRGLLREAVAEPAIREALFLASNDLEAALEPWLGGRLDAEKAARVERSLVRYLSRMAFRCTPFGLFAGTTTGAWGGSHLELAPWQASGRRTRLDMDALAAILASLENLPWVRATQTYRPNTSLYPIAGRLRYAEARGGTTKAREYHLVDLVPTGALEATLRRAAGGATLDTLAWPLMKETGVGHEEALAFCHELVDAQVLVGDLELPLTGGEALGRVIEGLRAQPSTRALVKPLEELPGALEALDRPGPGNAVERYRAFAAKLEVFPLALDLNRLFQVDQHRPALSLELPGRVRKALEGAVETLRRLSPPRPPGAMEAFRTAFQERYEGRWMPLLEVLDAEAGIGFGGEPLPGDAGLPLLEGVPLPGRSAQPARTFTERDAYLLRKVQGLPQGTVEWQLDDEDLAFLEHPQAPPFPASFAALAVLGAPTAEALAAGGFRFLMEQFAGPSGARLLARFCQADPDLEARVREHLAQEEAARPGVIFAEIVHLPDGRTGNILARPAFRTYEIPFLGVSGVPEANQILPSELLVNVVGGRAVLWSRRLGKEVVPRLASAHNYARGLAVYRFLGALQDQDGGSGAWQWGCLKGAPFLPRVARGRHVLCRARWRVENQELAAAMKASDQGVWGAFALLRQRRGLPRRVVLEDADNTLLVDLDQALWVETLWHLVRHRAFFTLTECFPDPGDLPLSGPEGRFTHELVVPFLARTESRPLLACQEVASACRSFPPGSEWLYVKLYCGRAVADRILAEGVAPLLDLTRGLWDTWFFVRYADPHPHLRLRFHGNPELLVRELLPWVHRMLEPLRRRGLGWKLQVDTYEREVERYGGPEGMALAEDWFWRDSEAVLQGLDDLQGDQGAQRRWRQALEDVDRMLGALGLDLEAKGRIARLGREGFLKETAGGRNLETVLGAHFRPLAGELADLLDREAPFNPSLASLARLGEAAHAGRLAQPLETLAPTLTHMHLNRLLRGEHRAQEGMLMDFLNRLYARLRARSAVRT